MSDIDGVGLASPAVQQEAVRAYYRASEAADGDAVAALMTEDVRWWVPQSAAAANAIPLPVEGRQALIDTFWKGARYQPGTRQWTIQRLVTDGDVTAAQATMKALMVGGAPYENRYVYLFRFEGDLIAEVWEYLDTAYFFQQANARGAPPPVFPPTANA